MTQPQLLIWSNILGLQAELIASLQGPDPPQEPTLTKEALESSPLSQTQYEVNMKANVGSDQPPVVMETTPDNSEETHGDTHTDSQTLERPKRMVCNDYHLTNT